jgi:hypothetical protein
MYSNKNILPGSGKTRLGLAKVQKYGAGRDSMLETKSNPGGETVAEF